MSEIEPVQKRKPGRPPHCRPPQHNPPVDYLHEALDYCPDDGTFVWKYRPLAHFKNEHGQTIFNRNFGGSPAGSTILQCYHIIRIGAVDYRAHRIAHAMMTGSWPEHNIKHANGNKLDNSWSNISGGGQRTWFQEARDVEIYTALWNDNFRGWGAWFEEGGHALCAGFFETKEEALAAGKGFSGSGYRLPKARLNGRPPMTA